MILSLAELVGAARYEFRMQVRRPTVWIVFAAFTGLLVLLLNQGQSALGPYYTHLVAHTTLLKALADWTFNVNTFLPICLGPLLADRLPRDHRTRVDELFTSMPAPLGTRLVGKYLGALLATLLPMLIIYAVGVGYIAFLARNPLAIPLAVVTFAAIALPGMLFVGAFSIACTAILWTPLYQFLFIGYWYWNTLWFHADIFNLSRTLLSPIGLIIVMGVFGLNESSDSQHVIHISATPLQGVASMVTLLAITALVLFALERYLHWRQVSQ